MFIGGTISGSSGPQLQTYSAPETFGSIIVFNQSGSPLAVWLGQTGNQGLPSFTVPQGVTVTYPIPGISVLTVELTSFPTTGACTVNMVDTVLSAGSGLIPFSSSGLLAQNGYLQFSTGLILQWGATPLVAFSYSTASIAFATAYSLALFAVVASANPVNSSDAFAIPVVAIVGSTLAAFAYAVGGGPPGSSGNVLWVALGV